MPAARLILICHAATAATKDAAFPADAPLSARGRSEAARLALRLRPTAQAFTSPAPAARETTAALGLDASALPALGEIDYGRWRGRTLADIEAEDPDGLAAWLGNPESAPHGGEPLVLLHARIAAWMGTALSGGGRTIAVTHASVIRAAICHVLGAPLAAFWRIDVAPLAIAEVRGHGERWTLRRLGDGAGAEAATDA
jgi:broad specificity phosphatase PhoE